ncbi:leucine-rich repeat-containing protein 46 isoform X2 [Rhinatrema bivittatum]|nr:leucine-rich repeat-containing protein 46 isoform X2 [Rhinatrema bivittatum]
MQALSLLHTVRLDREKITAIGNLEIVREIHSLYLQQNEIEKIEHLDGLSNLRFLTLAGNRIHNVENLTSLRHLRFLDLSDNQIERLEPGELPPSLLILHLTGNGCTKKKGYRELVMGRLPHLQELDGQPVPGKGREEPAVKNDVDPDSDDDFTEFLCPLNTDKGFFEFLHQMLWGRSVRRMTDAQREHQARVDELCDLLQPWNGTQTAMQVNLEQPQRPMKDPSAPNSVASGVKGATEVKFHITRVPGTSNKPKSKPCVARECISHVGSVKSVSVKAPVMRRETLQLKKDIVGTIKPVKARTNIPSSKTAALGLEK